jgi:hypothetical protein
MGMNIMGNSITGRKVSRPAKAGYAGSLPAGRQEGAQYKNDITLPGSRGFWPGSFNRSEEKLTSENGKGVGFPDE